ncbi:MAG: oxidative damage protection protein [Gammaproteobacteria bacterium]|nr:oxidative damage protection protein [Gammaproteobacteria bacterium]CAJ2376647.1 MAG: putative Fe(2(+))-trafficking protein [Arenicellales bacterium IbO2]MDA7961398.1 oxidative damage protection protein [Gammaproteobacteria bacterium]MDA7969045.1 oxidative damage protection protein [Gammaproteobacteria bacterium]MDA7970313.1 oxidative damage protection protein [Gammaproteobacteria bacterium]
MTRKVHCVKLGKESEGLDHPPWPGELGKRLFENVSKEAWQEWLRRQTILINEYKLNPLDAKHKRYLAEQMEAWFFGDGIVMPDEWRPE